MAILGGRLQRCIHLGRRVFVCSLVLATTLFSQGVDEYELKAAFLYNFTKFIEWSNLPNTDAFNICILGDDPFGGALDQLVKGKTAYHRKIQTLKLKEPFEARQCQIVYIRNEEESKAARVIEVVRGMQVLTVSEHSRFAKLGGMIFLSMKEGHVNVGINAQAAESAGLKISAKLMRLAMIFKDEIEEP